MKAAMYYGVGDIRMEDIPKPECPKGGVIMKVQYITTCGTDVKKYKRGHALSVAGASIFGHEGAGIVAEVGEGCTKFKVGDRICFHDSAPCGKCYWCRRGQHNLCESLEFTGGTYAEYVPISKNLVEWSAFKVPDDMHLELSPAIEPLACAVYCADEAHVQINDYVVVNGAGPLGLGIIACIANMGGRVISCDKSADRLALAKKMGAEWTIQVTDDMTLDDQVKAIRAITPNNRGCDICIEAVGLPQTWEMTLQTVRKGGTVIWFGGCKPGSKISVDATLMHYANITIKGIFHTTPKHVEMTFELMKRGVFKKEDFITGEYTFDNCVQALEDHYHQIGIKNLIKLF